MYDFDTDGLQSDMNSPSDYDMYGDTDGMGYGSTSSGYGDSYSYDASPQEEIFVSPDQILDDEMNE